MKPALRRVVRGLLWTMLLLAIGFFGALPRIVDGRMNRVMTGAAPRAPSDRAVALHGRLRIADLHCDALLWSRDLLSQNGRGHVDLPRLQRGNVSLQIMSAVTRVPYPLNIDHTVERRDAVALVALAELWPLSTWTSLTARALHQADKLHRFAAGSAGRWHILRSASDVDDFLARRAAERDLVASVLAIEGAHALDGDLANLDRLYQAGYRMIAPTHFFDTDIGGSAHGAKKGGLTEKGRAWVKRMDERRMLIDLAHASPSTIDEVARLSRQPLWVSHTGVRGTCDNRRNLSDDQLRLIARSGGVIGIGYWPTAVCGDTPRHIARAIRHAIAVAGTRHVALGSDFDGAVRAPFDSAGLVALTDALLEAGVGEDVIARVMGDNVWELLRKALP